MNTLLRRKEAQEQTCKKRAAEALEIIQAEGTITRDELARKMGVAFSTLNKYLEPISNEIIRLSAGREMTYEVKKPFAEIKLPKFLTYQQHKVIPFTDPAPVKRGADGERMRQYRDGTAI